MYVIFIYLFFSNGPIDTSNHISGVHQGLPQIPSSVSSGKVIATPHQSPISTSQTPSRPGFNECKPGAIEEKPPPYLEQKPPPYLDQKPPPYLDQKPPISFTDQKPPLSFTDQKLPLTYTDQKPPPGLIDQKPPIFEKHAVTPLSSGPPTISGPAVNSQYLHTPTTTSSVTFTTATSTTTTSAPLVTHHNHVGITSSTNSISNNSNGVPQGTPLVNGPLNSQPPLHRPASSSGGLGKYSVVSLVSSCAPSTNSTNSSSNSNIYNNSIINSGSSNNISNLTQVTSASCGSVVTVQSTISVANTDLQSSAAPIHHPLHHHPSSVPVHHRASTPTRHGAVLPPPPCTSSPNITGNTSAIDPVVSVKLEPGEPPVSVSHAHTLAHAKSSSYNTTLTSGVPYSHHPNISYPPRTSPATIGCIPSSAPTHSPAHSITAPPHSGTLSHSRLQNIKIEPDTHLKSVPSSAPRTSTPSHPGLPTSVRHSPARHSPRTQDPHPSLYR